VAMKVVYSEAGLYPDPATHILIDMQGEDW
jgi:hypothetical protein